MTAAAFSPLIVGKAKPEKDHMSRKEAAAYLTRIGCPMAPKTLANMASKDNAGGGPPFDRNGWKMVQYRRADLDAWAAARRVRVE
jgi:hypothetical protein